MVTNFSMADINLMNIIFSTMDTIFSMMNTTFRMMDFIMLNTRIMKKNHLIMFIAANSINGVEQGL